MDATKLCNALKRLMACLIYFAAAAVIFAVAGIAQGTITTAHASTGCAFPPAGPEETVIYIGSASGATKSAIELGERKDTGSSGVNITEDGGPLYLVLSAHEPTIWQLEGKASRIARLVLAGPALTDGKVLAGETGIDASKVTYIDEACFTGQSRIEGQPEPDETKTIPVFPDGTSLKYSAMAPKSGGYWFEVAESGVKHFAAPSVSSSDIAGKVGVNPNDIPLAAPAGFDEKAWQRLLMRHPGGLADFAGTTIVSDVGTRERNVAEDAPLLDLPSLWLLPKITEFLTMLFILYFCFMLPIKGWRLSRRMKRGFIRSTASLGAAELTSMVYSFSFCALFYFVIIKWFKPPYSIYPSVNIAAMVLMGLALVACLIMITSSIESFILTKCLAPENPQLLKKTVWRSNIKMYAYPILILALISGYSTLTSGDKKPPNFNETLPMWEGRRP